MLGQMKRRRRLQALLHLSTLAADNRPFSVADWIKSPHHQIGVLHMLNLNQSLVSVIYQVNSTGFFTALITISRIRRF
jgi:hypothetical protein